MVSVIKEILMSTPLSQLSDHDAVGINKVLIFHYIHVHNINFIYLLHNGDKSDYENLRSIKINSSWIYITSVV